MTDASGQARSSEDIRQALADLAELMLFRERFSEDPAGARERQGLMALPPAVVEALASLSPEELAVFAKVQQRLPDIPGSEEIGIFF